MTRPLPTASSAELVAVPKEHIKDTWPLVEPYLRDAAEASEGINLDDEYHDLRGGKSTLWMAWGRGCEAAAVTQGDTLVLCGGNDMKRWVHLIEGIEDHLRREGHAHMKIYGRPGWGRVLDGYRPMLEKAL